MVNHQNPTTLSETSSIHELTENHIKRVPYDRFAYKKYNLYKSYNLNNDFKARNKFYKRNRMLKRQDQDTLMGYDFRLSDNSQNLLPFPTNFNAFASINKMRSNNNKNVLVKQLTENRNHVNDPLYNKQTIDQNRMNSDYSDFMLKQVINNDANFFHQLNEILIKPNSLQRRPIIVAEMQTLPIVAFDQINLLPHGSKSTYRVPDLNTNQLSNIPQKMPPVEVTIQKSIPYFLGQYNYIPSFNKVNQSQSVPSSLVVPRQVFHYDKKSLNFNHLIHNSLSADRKPHGKRHSKSIEWKNGLERRVKMQYGFQPLFEPSPEIDIHGNVI